ncbi:MAG: hypothetical protein ISS87_00240 [Candidatus Pacebacteria bacterium]|nr:hypothetical protein [Candidatus Paceibacterota bacterium]
MEELLRRLRESVDLFNQSVSQTSRGDRLVACVKKKAGNSEANFLLSVLIYSVEARRAIRLGCSVGELYIYSDRRVKVRRSLEFPWKEISMSQRTESLFYLILKVMVNNPETIVIGIYSG